MKAMTAKELMDYEPSVDKESITKRIKFLENLIHKYKGMDIETEKFETELKEKQSELETLS
tara:strand:- start:665 stop:847 length:183 start_codon:yes stop_codon:yes gene_type:complete